MSYYQDEIDLRPYILVLIKEWWKIGLIAIIIAGVTLAFTKSQARRYQATATIVLTRSQMKLSLAEQFPTVSELRIDPSRKDAFLTIIGSDSIARVIYDVLGDQKLKNYDSFAILKEGVEVNSVGDAIQINATAENPDLAAEIANTWAQESTHAINLAYSGEQPLSEIQNQIISAEQSYRDAQTELEEFMATNSIVELETTIQLVEATLNSYIENKTWEIGYQYQKKQRFKQLFDQASTIKTQLADGTRSNAGNFGDALAVMNIRANFLPTYELADVDQNEETFSILVTNKNTENWLEIQLSDVTALLDTTANYLQDVDTIIELAEQEYEHIEQNEEDLETTAYEGVEDAYAPLAAVIQTLRAQLENLTARERELISDRDLAWEAYQALLEKETEIKTASQANIEVALASPAIPPKKPVPRNTIIKTIIGGSVGLFIGTLWFLVSEWWRSANLDLSSNDKTTKNSKDS